VLIVKGEGTNVQSEWSVDVVKTSVTSGGTDFYVRYNACIEQKGRHIGGVIEQCLCKLLRLYSIVCRSWDIGGVTLTGDIRSTRR
jgi:hypothetical protein